MKLEEICKFFNKSYLVLPASPQPGAKALSLTPFMFLCFCPSPFKRKNSLQAGFLPSLRYPGQDCVGEQGSSCLTSPFIPGGNWEC